MFLIKMLKHISLNTKMILVGFFELIFHTEKKEIEIAYFGLLEEYQNKKLGSYLLSEAIKNLLQNNKEFGFILVL